MVKASNYVFQKSFLVIFVVLLFGLVGCDDDPVSPPSENSSFDTVLVSPKLAWGGIQWSLDNVDPEGWEAVLSENFTYSPDPVSAEKFPTAFISWNQVSEASFVRALLSSGLELEAIMFPIGYNPPTPTGTEVTWESIEYTVQVTNPVDNSSLVYQGIANIVFHLEGSFWYLFSWEDLSGSIVPWNPDVVLPTLGDLRGTLGSVE